MGLPLAGDVPLATEKALRAPPAETAIRPGDKVTIMFEPERPNQSGYYRGEGTMGHVHFVGTKRTKDCPGWWVPLSMIRKME